MMVHDSALYVWYLQWLTMDQWLLLMANHYEPMATNTIIYNGQMVTTNGCILEIIATVTQ